MPSVSIKNKWTHTKKISTNSQVTPVNTTTTSKVTPPMHGKH